MLAALLLHRWNTDTWNHVTRAIRLDNPARDIEADRVVNLFERNGHYEPVEFTLPDIGAAKPGPRSSTPPDPSTVTTRTALRPAPLSLAGALHHRPAQAELSGLPTAGMRARRSHLVESGVEDFLGE